MFPVYKFNQNQEERIGLVFFIDRYSIIIIYDVCL